MMMIKILFVLKKVIIIIIFGQLMHVKLKLYNLKRFMCFVSAKLQEKSLFLIINNFISNLIQFGNLFIYIKI